MIHDVITTPDPFPCSAKSMFVGVRNNKTQQIRHWKINKIRTKCYCISKISNSVGRNDTFLAKARKLSIFPTSLDILIYGNTVYVFSIYVTSYVFWLLSLSMMQHILSCYISAYLGMFYNT